MFQEDDARTAEGTAEKNEDGARGNRGTKLGGFVNVLARGNGLLDVIGGIPFGALIKDDGAHAAILFTADRLGDGLDGWFFGLCGDGECKRGHNGRRG